MFNCLSSYLVLAAYEIVELPFQWKFRAFGAFSVRSGNPLFYHHWFNKSHTSLVFGRCYTNNDSLVWVANNGLESFILCYLKNVITKSDRFGFYLLDLFWRAYLSIKEKRKQQLKNKMKIIFHLHFSTNTCLQTFVYIMVYPSIKKNRDFKARRSDCGLFPAF